MAGGTFKLSQPKVRPGTYVNVRNGKQPVASVSARGTAVIPLIGYDWELFGLQLFALKFSCQLN